jgi:hypothetical protein
MSTEKPLCEDGRHLRIVDEDFVVSSFAEMLLEVPALQGKSLDGDSTGVPVLVSGIAFNVEKNAVFVGIYVVFIMSSLFEKFLLEVEI